MSHCYIWDYNWINSIKYESLFSSQYLNIPKILRLRVNLCSLVLTQSADRSNTVIAWLGQSKDVLWYQVSLSRLTAFLFKGFDVLVTFFRSTFCRLLRGHWFFHPRPNGQWPPTSKDFLSQILSITFIFLS